MSFPLVGNSKINLSITNILKERRLPHAILIEGEKGTGRHTLALFLAKAAVCIGDTIPCGCCKSCGLVQNKNHPDISVVKPLDNKKNIAVAQIRELRNEAFVKPHMSAKRVFIIDRADTMNESAQNALLKVLEEPPQTVIFILLVESRSALLDTIISRCAFFGLSVPSRESAVEYICGVTDFSRELVVSALEDSHNNIGDALSTLRGESKNSALTTAQEFLTAFLNKNSWEMLTVLKGCEKNRVEAALFLKNLKICIANKLRENARLYNAKALFELYNLACSLEKNLDKNINLSLLFCNLNANAQKLITNR